MGSNTEDAPLKGTNPPQPSPKQSKLTPPPAIIIGAGLGGCAAALALKAQGFDVTVYERLKTFRRLGDSLGLGENALKLLRRWGGQRLYDDLCAIGNQAEDMQIREWSSGRVLARQPLMDMGKAITRCESLRRIRLTCVAALVSGLHRPPRRLPRSLPASHPRRRRAHPHGPRNHLLRRIPTLHHARRRPRIHRRRRHRRRRDQIPRPRTRARLQRPPAIKRVLVLPGVLPRFDSEGGAEVR